MPSSHRVLACVLLVIASMTTACQKQPPAAAPAVVSETVPSIAPEPTPEDVGPSRQPLDLRVAGIWAKIDVPEKTTLVIADREECVLKCGSSFLIRITRLAETPEAAKTRLTAAGAKLIDSTDAGFTEETVEPIPSRRCWRLFNPHPAGYLISASETTKATPGQRERMLESIRTFRAIPFSVEEMTRSQQAMADLRQAGVVITPRSAGLEIDFPWRPETEKFLPRVTELNRVARLRITGAGPLSAGQLKLAAGCAGLTSLQLRNVQVAEADWGALEGLASLREIRIEQSPAKSPVSEAATAKLLERLGKIASLRSVVFRRHLVDEAVCKLAVSWAKPLSAEIGFEDAGLSGRELKLLAENTKWQGLSLADNPITNVDLINLRELRELKSIDLSGCKTDDRASSYLSELPLSRLNLSRTELTDKGITPIAKSFPNLTRLDASATLVTGAGLEPLAKLATLRELILTHQAVGSASLETLKTCVDLRVLGLANTTVVAGDLPKVIAAFPRLELLDLRATATDAEGLGKVTKARPECVVLTEGTPADDGRPAEAPLPDPIAAKAPAQLPAADAAALIKKFDGKIIRNEELEGKPIVELLFSSPEMTDTDLSQLRDLKTLERLRLDGCKKITEAGLVPLGDLPALSQLFLSRTGVGSNVCASIGRFKKLTVLELPEIAVSRKHLTLLGSLKELESIRGLRVVGEPEAFVDFLAGATKLKRFDWSAIEWNDRRLRKLKALTALETLEIRGPWLGNGAIEIASGFANLRELTIQSDLISDSGMKPLDKLTNLRKLRLEGRRFGDAMLIPLRNNADLETVRLNCPGFTDRGAVPLRSFQKMLELDLHDTPLGDGTLQNLVDCKDLELIDLSGTRVSDEGLKNFKGMDELRKLMLGRTTITGIGFKSLSSLQRLSRLELDRCKLTNTGLESIATIASLEDLDLSDSQAGDTAIMPLRQLPALQRLRLNRNVMLTDKVADTLITFPSLTEVSLLGSKLTAKGLAVLRKKEGLTVIAE